VATEERVPIGSDADVVTARAAGRQLAQPLGFTGTDLTLIATAISEIARNIVLYAGEGEMRIRVLDERERQGVEVVATDGGPGISDVPLAMQDHYSTGSGMGLGLPGARRLMDDFDIQSHLGEGTRVTMRKWAARRV